MASFNRPDSDDLLTDELTFTNKASSPQQKVFLESAHHYDGAAEDFGAGALEMLAESSSEDPEDIAEPKSERRVSPRFDKAFPVFFSSDRGISYGIARNVSEGGMYIELLESAPIGSRVTVTFAWPGSNAEMSVEAQVRYATALNFGGASDQPPSAICGVGLRFIRFLVQDLYDEGHPPDLAALH